MTERGAVAWRAEGALRSIPGQRDGAGELGLSREGGGLWFRGAEPRAAFERVTHLGVGAHADDLEILAAHGILRGLEPGDSSFGGVVVTDGAGSVRTEQHRALSEREFTRVRLAEQLRAAELGQYQALAWLDHPSSSVKAGSAPLKQELVALLRATHPRVVYTHSPFDHHATHAAVTAHLIAALRELPEELRPERLLGCEVWGGLDWLPAEWKVELDVSSRRDLQGQLIGVFASQLAAGKRYDAATLGRRQAQATFSSSRHPDARTGVICALDLSSLLRDPKMDVLELAREVLDAALATVERHLPGRL